MNHVSYDYLMQDNVKFKQHTFQITIEFKIEDTLPKPSGLVVRG